MAAEAALALVNIEVGQYYWLPWDTPRAVILMGVPWQSVVQPHLSVHHGQGRLGHAGGWISGNQGERQGAVRPTYVVKISWAEPIIIEYSQRCFTAPSLVRKIVV